MSHAAPSIEHEDLQHIASAALPWAQLHRKTVMVTGGGGFLAAYLVKALLHTSRTQGLGVRVICVARKLASVQARLGAYLHDADFSVVLHDVSQPLPADFPHADIIIHSASQASPKYYGTDPVGTLLPNTAGTLHLLEHARKCQSARFLFFSSGEVYGVTPTSAHSIAEQDYGYLDPMNVRACYAESKRMGETMCVAWAQQHGLHTSVVRPFHTYGPGMALDDGRVFADFVADVVAQRPVTLKSDGLAQRAFCYLSDATIGFLTVLLQGKTAQAYNVANPAAEISIRDLATLVAKLFPARCPGTHFETAIDSANYLRSPIARACPSIEKIQALGWTPRTGLEEGFRRTIASFIENDQRSY